MKQNDPLEIKPPKISEETKRRMVAFFMKTSIPRIMAADNERCKKEGES